MRKIFLGIFFSFSCCSVCGCDRTQSSQDVYKEIDSHKENIVIDTETDTQKMDEVKWISLSTDYLFEDEVTVAYKFWKKDDLKVRVLDAFYADLPEAGGEYFITSEWQQHIAKWCENECTNALFIDIEIENIGDIPISYCVADIEPYACKLNRNNDNVEVCEINVTNELAYDGSEDVDGGLDYYYIYLQPQEKRTFRVCFLVYPEILTENKDNIYIDASTGFLDVSENGNPNPSGIGFKLLHIPVREIQKGDDK